jgi:hypothetical protein
MLLNDMGLGAGTSVWQVQMFCLPGKAKPFPGVLSHATGSLNI